MVNKFKVGDLIISKQTGTLYSIFDITDTEEYVLDLECYSERVFAKLLKRSEFHLYSIPNDKDIIEILSSGLYTALVENYITGL